MEDAARRLVEEDDFPSRGRRPNGSANTLEGGVLISTAFLKCSGVATFVPVKATFPIMYHTCVESQLGMRVCPREEVYDSSDRVDL